MHEWALYSQHLFVLWEKYMSLPPAARPPGRKLSPESARDVARVRRVQGTLAEYFPLVTGPEYGNIQIWPTRFFMPSRAKRVLAWRDMKTGRFSKRPGYILSVEGTK